MKLLEERILKEGKVLPGDVLKVDNFLNHQVDINLMTQLAEEIKKQFLYDSVSKVLTIETSGIPLACMVAQALKVPMVFAKKSKTSNLGADFYSQKVFSYTHNTEYDILVSKAYLTKGERVLLVDDFLANGKALSSLIRLVKEAGAVPVGAAVAIEKGYQGGGDALRAEGQKIVSLAIIDSMDGQAIKFRS